FELRVAEPICCAKSELITHKLVQRDGDCPFLEFERFAGGRRAGRRIKLDNAQSAIHVRPRDFARDAQVSPRLEPLFESDAVVLEFRRDRRAGGGFRDQASECLVESSYLGGLQAKALVDTDSAQGFRIGGADGGRTKWR